MSEGDQYLHNCAIQKQHNTKTRPPCQYGVDNHSRIRPSKRTRMANASLKCSNTKVPQSNELRSNLNYGTQRNGGPKRWELWKRPVTTVDTLPYPAEGVEVVYTNHPADAESWLKNNVIDSEADALGLDIEWRPQFVSKKNGGSENKTAVLQLAVDDSSLVLHIFHMKSLPKSLSQVLADRSVLKVGSGIKGDAIKILKDTGMLCDGRVDTQDYAKALGIMEGAGLKNLSKIVLNIDLNKPKKISMSNWEFFPLQKDQIGYAALDAWIGLKLYINMKGQLALKNKGSSVPEVINVEVDEPIHVSRTFTCQGCSETLETKAKLFRHKFRCQIVRTTQKTQNQVLLGGNDQSNQLNEQINSDQTSSSTVSNSAEHGSSSSQCSSSSVLSEERSDGNDVIICPVFQCAVKCLGQEGFQEHVRLSAHACCKECGKVFRSKVSRNHKKQHAAERKEKNI